LQARGDTVSMQYALIGAFFANIGLNPLMMFGIPGIWDGMGFDGIAAATVISQTGVMVFIGFRLAGSSLIDQKKFVDILPDLTVYRQILAQLLPTTFTMLVMFTAGFIVQFYLKTFGTSAVAAYGVALRVEQLFLLPVFGLTGALLPIAAQNFRRWRKRARSHCIIHLLEIWLAIYVCGLPNPVFCRAFFDAYLYP
jgi:Na+-driven multidrug efflux pump